MHRLPMDLEKVPILLTISFITVQISSNTPINCNQIFTARNEKCLEIAFRILPRISLRTVVPHRITTLVRFNICFTYQKNLLRDKRFAATVRKLVKIVEGE